MPMSSAILSSERWVKPLRPRERRRILGRLLTGAHSAWYMENIKLTQSAFERLNVLCLTGQVSTTIYVKLEHGGHGKKSIRFLTRASRRRYHAAKLCRE